MIITIIILTVTAILHIFESSGALAESIVRKTSGGNLAYLAIFPGSYGILRVCLQSDPFSIIYLLKTHSELSEWHFSYNLIFS